MTMLARPFPALMLVLMASGAMLAAGCARITETQGYLADQELLMSVQPGVDNKESVAKTLGRPTMMSQWDDDHWYYVSRTTRQFAFLRSQPAAQNILMVTFGPDGTVTAVQRRGLEQVADIVPDKDKTPTLGREATLLEDLFGNIGTVGAVPGAGGPPQ